jgi:hypothetical protein
MGALVTRSTSSSSLCRIALRRSTTSRMQALRSAGSPTASNCGHASASRRSSTGAAHLVLRARSRNPSQRAQGISNTCGNDALVAGAVVVEVAASLAGEVGDYAASVAPAYGNRLCVGVLTAPARVAKRAVKLVCKDIIGPHALGECSKRHFERFELIVRCRACVRFAVALHRKRSVAFCLRSLGGGR